MWLENKTNMLITMYIAQKDLASLGCNFLFVQLPAVLCAGVVLGCVRCAWVCGRQRSGVVCTFSHDSTLW